MKENLIHFVIFSIAILYEPYKIKAMPYGPYEMAHIMKLKE